MWVKLTGTTVTMCVAAVMWMLTTFETVESSEQKWASHNQALQCRTVNTLKIKQLDLEEKVQKTKDQQDREFYVKQLEYVRSEIKRLDPQGVC